MEISEIYKLLVHRRYAVFFGDKGLSISEASHKADLTKEKATAIGALFTNTSAYNSILKFEGEDVALDTFISLDLYGLSHKEGDLYTLSAWLREAIAAKATLLEFYQNAPHSSLLINDEKIPALYAELKPMLKPTIREIFIDDKSVIGKLTIAERAEYLSLEARAAHLGKKIHPGGVIANIRKDLQNKKANSFVEKANGAGKKAYVATHKPIYKLDEIDTIFFKLQDEHREIERALNAYKARIKNDVTVTNAKIQQVYNNALDANKKGHNAELELYNQAFADAALVQRNYTQGLELRRLNLIHHISALKVVMPNELKASLDALDEKK